MGKGLGFPLAAEDDDEFDDVCVFNLPGPEFRATGGGNGIGDDNEVGGAGMPILGRGGGGGPKAKDFLLFYILINNMKTHLEC